MGLYIFIDDVRTAPSDYDLTFRTAEAFYEWLEVNKDTDVDLVSLDYFLADENVSHKTGLDIAKYLVSTEHSIMDTQVHSDYFDGGKEIFNVLREGARSELNPMFRGCSPFKIRITDDGDEFEMESLNFRD